MGYRSEVVITLSKEKSDLLQAMYCENFPEDTEWLFDGIQKMDKENVLYYFSSVKWYDGYKEVDFINSFLAELKEEEYRFLRTGEAPDDIDDLGCSEAFDARVRHEVIIEWDG